MYSYLEYVHTKSNNVFKVKLKGLKQSLSRMSRSFSMHFQPMSLIVYAGLKARS